MVDKNTQPNSRKSKDGDIKSAAQPVVDFTTAEQSDKEKMPMWALFELLFDQKLEAQNSAGFSITSFEQLMSQGQLTQGDIFTADTTNDKIRDAEVGEYIDTQTGRHTYYVGENLKAFRSSHHDLGPDNFRMKNIGQIQTELVSAVEKAAAVTGVPVKLLGAMAGKESTFGKNQVSGSGAEGLFQQTDGYLKANYVDNQKQAAFIARYVPEAAKYMADDGRISLNEARRLSWNPEAAAIMTALRAKDLAQDLNLDLNNTSSWALVYTDHNAGRGSVNKLLKGGMTDEWIQRLNPSMYKGANSAQDVFDIAGRDMARWGDRFEKLSSQISGRPTPVVTADNVERAAPAAHTTSVRSVASTHVDAPHTKSSIIVPDFTSAVASAKEQVASVAQKGLAFINKGLEHFTHG